MDILLPEELHDLLLSRRIDSKGVPHFQTLSGHISDLVKSLYGYILEYEHALKNISELCAVAPEDVFQTLYFAVCLSHVYKADKSYQDYLRQSEWSDDSKHAPESVEQCIVSLCLKLINVSHGYNNRDLMNDEMRHREPRENDWSRPGDRYEWYWTRLFDCYRKFSFKQWFRLGKNESVEFRNLFIMQRSNKHEINAPGRKFPEDVLLHRLDAVVQHCLYICHSAADRQFLEKIFGTSWNRPYVIHGAILTNIPRRRGNYPVLKNPSHHRKSDYTAHGAQKPPFECYISNSIGNRMKKVAEWISQVSGKSRVIVVAPSEEILIALGFYLNRKMPHTQFYYYNSGVVSFDRKGIMPVDTRILSPDKTSEPVESLPVDSGAVSLHTYQNFFHSLFDADGDNRAFRGSVLNSSVVIWGMAQGIDESFQKFTRSLNLIFNNKISTLILLEGHDHEHKKTFHKLYSQIPEETEKSDTTVSPILKKSPFPFFDDSQSVHSEFALQILKHYRQGINQIILGPNPAYVQKMYFELSNRFLKKWVPYRSIELYHSLYSLRDKTKKRLEIETVSQHGPVIVVSTLSFFPEAFRMFPVIFAERLPFVKTMSRLFEYIQDYSPHPQFPVPEIMWHFGEVSPDDLQFVIDDDVSGPVDKQKLEKWIAESQKSMVHREEDSGWKCKIPAVPQYHSFHDNELDMANRFMFPLRSRAAYDELVLQQEPKSKFMRRLPCGIFLCTLPYHTRLGLIGPREWMEENIE